MVKRIGNVNIDHVVLDAMDSVLINIDSASEVLSELWLKKTDLSNNALGQAIHRLNEVKAFNLEGAEPFYKRYPQLYPGLKSGSKPTTAQNRQIARALEEFLYDAGLATGAGVGEADPPRQGMTGTKMATGVAVEGSDKLYPPRMVFTQAYRDMVDNIMGDREWIPEWKEWRENESRISQELSDKKILLDPDQTSAKARSVKGHKITTEILRQGIKLSIIPDAIKRIKAGKGRIDKFIAKGVVHLEPEEYAAKSQLLEDKRPGRPSNQATIRLEDDAPHLPLGEDRLAQPKVTEKVPALKTSILDEGFNYVPDESTARARAVDTGRTNTTIRYQVRKSIYDGWGDALNKMQHYGEKEDRNFKKLLWNRIQEMEAAQGISGRDMTSQKELYDSLDLLEKEGFLEQDKTIKGGKGPSNLHNGEVSKYVRPTEKGRDFKNLKPALKINSKDDLRIAYNTYSTNIDEATGKPKSRSTMADFAKTLPDYGKDSKLLKSLPFIGPIIGALSGYFSDPDPAEAHPGTPVGRAVSEAARSFLPLPLDASPVARAQLTDRYTPEQLEQMRMDQELEQTMSPEEMGSREAAFGDIESRTLGGFLKYEPDDDKFHYRPPTP